MQKKTYKNLIASRDNFEKLLNDLQLNIEPNSWLDCAYGLVGALSLIYGDDKLTRSFLDKNNKKGEVYSALFDISLLADILPYISLDDKKILKPKFKKILRMALPNAETTINSEARNILWEFNFLSRLKRAGIDVRLGEPNPDIVANFGQRKYYIQCKRVYSSKRNALKRNVINAINQLKNDLSRKDNNSFGMIALSLDHSITGGKLMLAGDSGKTAQEELVSILEEIITRHGFLWQNHCLIKDPRIVAVALHLSVPAIVNRENLFVTVSELIINNTWSDGQGIKTFLSDFEPLKRAMER